MAGFVVSVEEATVTLEGSSGVNSGVFVEHALTKSQTVADCVPFWTQETTSVTIDVAQENFTDAFFVTSPSDRLRIERSRTGASAAVTEITITAYIVEFDPSVITVQTFAWSIAASTTSVTINTEFTAVSATTEAFILFSGKMTSGGNTDGLDELSFEMTWDSTSSFTLTRDLSGTSSAISGNYFIVEDIGSIFTVQPVDLDLTSAEAGNTASISPAVDKTASFVVTGNRTGTPNDDANSGLLEIEITSDSVLTGTRYATGGEAMNGQHQVVEFDEAGVNCYHEVQAYTASETSQTHTQSVNASFSWPVGGCNVFGRNNSRQNAGSSLRNECSFRANLAAASTVITRDTAADAASMNSQIMEGVEFSAGVVNVDSWHPDTNQPYPDEVSIVPY